MKLFTPQKETWFYHVNPAFKFLLILIALLVTLFNRNFAFALHLLILYILSLVLWSGYSWRKLLLLLAPFILIFISTASTMILFGKGDVIWWTWGIIKISEESFFRGLLLSMKTVSFGVMGLLFVLTTKPLLFFYALMQQFHLPPKYGYSFIAAIRLLPTVWEEFHTRTNALKIRGVRYKAGIKGIYERIRLYAVPLLAQSIRRAQRIAVAMEAKQFHIGSSRTYYYATSYSRLDAVLLLIIVGLLLFAYTSAQYIPLFEWEPPIQQ
ncbi:energy-coupling factor transporter transmembrane component T family protein [Paenibacillus arenosi]|uniref:Energy-coupling factor transporter transmembrane protein EcfT n=1 Tax=Paenibacillus arenosi TaxID=2774142 RepID=A0ABR9AW41_9BACL|nr:energy-coupling factor transporter transmembrane component T [Paenibacillus arenosi]MBD8497420.1 energy-coupling factor transporter transmembrane protein EcfT [Paenibacillus arenosi]